MQYQKEEEEYHLISGMKKYAILCPLDIGTVEFSYSFAPKIIKLFDDPKTMFIFDDSTILVPKYLSTMGFRNCILYHLGQKPRVNRGLYRTKGGFINEADLRAGLLGDANGGVIGG
jgi:hypothetical protein